MVTEATLALDPLPRFWKHLHATWHQDTVPWNTAIEAIQSLQREGILTTSVALHNADKILSYVNPGPQAPRRTEDIRKQQLEAIEGGDWFVEAAISGATPAHLEASQQAVSDDFKALGIPCAWAETNQPGPMYHQFTQPSLATLYGAIGRDEPVYPTPEADNIGALWYAVVVPGAADMAKVAALVSAQGLKWDMDMPLTFQIPHHRYAYAVLSWLYDRRDSALESRMLEAYQATKEALRQQGYGPYRRGWMDQQEAIPSNTVTERWLAAMRNTTDPMGILAPGHYEA
ncbi:MAG: hypothetical protein AAFQ98_21770 [Bacteroidota bacterium]